MFHRSETLISAKDRIGQLGYADCTIRLSLDIAVVISYTVASLFILFTLQQSFQLVFDISPP